MGGTKEDQNGAPSEGRAFRMELYSNRGDALEKMGRVDPSEKSLVRKLFDLFF